MAPMQAKKMRRAIKNRESAQRSRKRKRERLNLLETHTVEQQQHIALLHARVATLEALIRSNGIAVPAAPAPALRIAAAAPARETNKASAVRPVAAPTASTPTATTPCRSRSSGARW